MVDLFNDAELAEKEITASDDIKLLYQMLNNLVDNVSKIQDQLDNLKFQIDNQNINNERNKTVSLDTSIRRYSKASKVVANVVEIIADGIISIVDNLQETPTTSSAQTIESNELNKSGKKIDISGILKATEGLIGNITSSIESGRKP